MPRTVTIRISLVLALLLVTAGFGMYGYGLLQAEQSGDARAGIHVEQVETTESSVVNVSLLSPDQRALFLLARNSSSGSYLTTDDHLQHVANDMPRAVFVEGDVYEIQRTHVDSIPDIELQILGALTTALGSLGLLVIGAATGIHRLRDRPKAD